MAIACLALVVKFTRWPIATIKTLREFKSACGIVKDSVCWRRIASWDDLITREASAVVALGRFTSGTWLTLNRETTVEWSAYDGAQGIFIKNLVSVWSVARWWSLERGEARCIVTLVTWAGLISWARGTGASIFSNTPNNNSLTWITVRHIDVRWIAALARTSGIVTAKLSLMVECTLSWRVAWCT